MRDFQKLSVWQKSHSLTLKIYKLTSSFPHHELYGLSSQMRRSSCSIPTNIAEGCGRHTNAELNRFLMMAAGSSSELQYQLILARDLNYFSENLFKELYNETVEIRKMIYSLTQKIKADS